MTTPCRYAAGDPLHECMRYDGSPVGDGDCWYEARTSLNDEQHIAIVERVTRSRAAQGLPPTITDPAILQRVAAILDAPGARRAS